MPLSIPTYVWCISSCVLVLLQLLLLVAAAARINPRSQRVERSVTLWDNDCLTPTGAGRQRLSQHRHLWPLNPLPPASWVSIIFVSPPFLFSSSRCCCLYVRCSPTPTRMIRSYQRSRRLVPCLLFGLGGPVAFFFFVAFSSSCRVLSCRIPTLPETVVCCVLVFLSK